MSGEWNENVRLARGRRRGSAPFCPKTILHSFGFRPSVDLDKLGQLADELEAEAFAGLRGGRSVQTSSALR